MINKNFGCDSCVHAAVCGIKKDRERLITEIERMAQRPEYSVFNLHCMCDYWMGDRDKLSEKIKGGPLRDGYGIGVTA